MDLVREMLPILDDFERALKVETADRELRQRRRTDLPAAVRHAQEDGPGADRNRRASSSIRTCTRRWSGCETEDAEDQTILGEFQRGYNFKGKASPARDGEGRGQAVVRQ